MKPILSTESLLQVSSYWRSVALTSSQLFSVADWTRWPVEKLRLWVERSAAAGLAVTLRYYEFNDKKKRWNINTEVVEFLKSTSNLWRALNIQYDGAHGGALFPNHLLQVDAPNL